LPGWVLACRPAALSLNRLTRYLREATVPVIGRIQDDRLLIDPRTLDEADENLLLQTLKDILNP